MCAGCLLAPFSLTPPCCWACLDVLAPPHSQPPLAVVPFVPTGSHECCRRVSLEASQRASKRSTALATRATPFAPPSPPPLLFRTSLASPLPLLSNIAYNIAKNAHLTPPFALLKQRFQKAELWSLLHVVGHHCGRSRTVQGHLYCKWYAIPDLAVGDGAALAFSAARTFHGPFLPYVLN